jgi:hypothetical protein
MGLRSEKSDLKFLIVTTTLGYEPMMRTVVFVGGMLAAMAAWTSTACTAEQAEIYKIEEDWEMVINEPDPANFSPQITFITSPSVNSNSVYFQLQLNYAADSQFSGGGFHVAAVQDAQMLDEARSETESPLAISGDHVRWTSVMAAVDHNLFFAVKNGYSSEWGEFGGPDYLVKILYHPQQSLDTVDVGFGANRIDSLTLLRVRAFYTDGRMVTVPVNRQPEK